MREHGMPATITSLSCKLWEIPGELNGSEAVNWKRGALAGGAGAAALLAAYGGFIAMLLLSFWGVSFMPMSGGTSGPSLAIRLVLLLLTAGVVSVVIALPARVLGASWGRSLLAALAADLLMVVLITTAFVLEEHLSTIVLQVGLVLVPVLIVMVGILHHIHGNGLKRAALVVSPATIFMVVALLSTDTWIDRFVVLAPWIILPAIAGLAQR